MTFRKKKGLLLASVAALLLLAILDVTFRKEEVFEIFGLQFVNAAKTEAHGQAHPDVTAAASRQVQAEAQGVQAVDLSGTRGNMAVKRSEDSAIRLEYTVTAEGKDKETADRRLQAIQVKKELRDGTLHWITDANGKEVDYRSVTIDYVLYVPDGLKLRLGNESGDVRIHGIRGDVEAGSDHGVLEVAGVTGNLSVEIGHGSLYVTEIAGNIDLSGRFAEVHMDRIKGDVVLDNEFGHTFITRLEGKVAGQAVQGSLHLRDSSGTVELDSRISDVVLDRVRGDIRVTSVSGGITVILAEAEGYRLDAAVQGGRIHSPLPTPVEQVREGEYTSRLQGSVGSGTWKVDVKARPGDITIHSK